jgi:hypothetical protein
MNVRHPSLLRPEPDITMTNATSLPPACDGAHALLCADLKVFLFFF